MTKLKNILEKINNILKWITGIFLLIMLSITFVQVVMRYIFNKPFMWAEEVTLAILIWFGYLSISMVVKEDDHMSIEFFYNIFGKKMKMALDVIRHILMVGFSTLMTYYGIEMVKNAIGKFLPASKISRTMLYIPLVVSGILIVIFSIVHLIKLFNPEEKEGI